MNVNRKKALIGAGILLLVSTMGFAAWRALNPGDAPGKPVQTVLVQEMDMEARVFVNGTIQSKKIRSVTGDVSGKVLTVPVEVGSPVAEGDILCTLDPGDLEYLIEQKTLQIEQEKQRTAQANINRNGTLKSKLDLAIKTVERAREELERRKALYDSGALSASEYQDYVYRHQQAQDELVSAKSAYESREEEINSGFQVKLLTSELDKLREDLGKKVIRSPISGVVTAVNIKPYSDVTVEGPLFVVEDTTDLEAVTQISEFDISKVKIGQEVLLQPTGLKGVELKGRVSSIAPTAKLQTTGQTRETVVEVKIDVLEPVQELKSNFSTEIIIKAESRQKALTVPYEALYISPEGVRQVFAVESGVVRIRPITAGIEGDLALEVDFEGIKKDLPVILNPTDALKDGDKVTPVDQEGVGQKP